MTKAWEDQLLKDIVTELDRLSAGKSSDREGVWTMDQGPDYYDFEKEKEIRKLMVEAAEYDEEGGPTFDPDGEYLCGTCFYRIVLESGGARAGRCWIVEGAIELETGSCRKYKSGDKQSNNPLPMAEQYTQIDAGYAERPKAKGFGCYPRCGHAAVAEGQDNEGRTTWCDQFGVHVQSKACCFFEGGSDLVMPKT